MIHQGMVIINIDPNPRNLHMPQRKNELKRKIDFLEGAPSGFLDEKDDF